MWWLLNHDWNQSLGVTMALEEDSMGAIATGRFNLKKEIARDTFSDYLLFAEHGRTLQHSVRVLPIKYEINNDVLIVSEWKMKEWSTLTRPGAIEETETISIKSMPDDIEMLKKALNLNFSDEKLKSIENKINDLESLIRSAAESTDREKSAKQIRETINFINKLTF
jgi:hypothetical protein